MNFSAKNPPYRQALAVSSNKIGTVQTSMDSAKNKLLKT
jgi:hypothetical protein